MRDQRGGVAERGGLDDLAGVAVVGGDDDQRVAVRALVVEGLLDRGVEGDGLTDLTARVRGVVLLVDRGALDLQEEALLAVLGLLVQHVERLGRHLGQVRLGGGAGGVRGALRRSGAGARRRRADPLQVHVVRGERAQDRGARGGLAQAGGVGDDLVAGRLRLVGHGLALERAGLHGLVEEDLAAAEQHVRLGLHELLGDRAGAAVDLVVDSTGGHRLRALAAAVDDVRAEHGRRRVLELGGGHVAGPVSGLLRQLQDRRHGLAVRKHRDRAVVGLAAGRPAGAGRGRVGHVFGQGRVRLLHGVGGVRAGQRQRVHGQPAVRPDLVVAGDGDLAVAHAVTDQQDDVAGGAALDGALGGPGLVLVRVTGHCHRRDRDDRDGGGREGHASSDIHTFALPHVSVRPRPSASGNAEVSVRF